MAFDRLLDIMPFGFVGFVCANKRSVDISLALIVGKRGSFEK